MVLKRESYQMVQLALERRVVVSGVSASQGRHGGKYFYGFATCLVDLVPTSCAILTFDEGPRLAVPP